MWFKKDLRIRDHACLSRAAARGPLICLYVYEPELIEAPDFDAQHLAVINESLQELDRDLRTRGGMMVYRVGDMPGVLAELHRQFTIETLWSHQETGNNLSYQRDIRVGDWCRTNGVRWREPVQNGVVRRLKDRDGWSDRWRKRMKKDIYPTPERLTTPLNLDPQVQREERDFSLPTCDRPERLVGGERAALERLDSFLTVRGENYQSQLSSPVTAYQACSRLSLSFTYGNISMKQVAQATWARQAEARLVRKATGVKDSWLSSLRSFQGRLHWRCHFTQKLEDQPSLEWENQARVYDGLRENHFNQERFDAWCAGETGYPMVDACMRALRLGGWINFRMRAMLVSFASYHLWLDWRPTSLYLAKEFIDYEPGIHYPQFQMQSGVTGINTVRVYSPAKQVLDQDPSGVFIRRYVPELEDVPDKYLSQPHTMPGDLQRKIGCVMGKDYPEPLVDHKTAVKAAKDAVYAVRRREDAKEESARVYQKHGSRRRPTSRG